MDGSGHRARHPWSPPTDAGAMVQALPALSRAVHSHDDWKSSVNAILARIGEVTATSRVWIFQTLELTPTHVIQDYGFEWAADCGVAQLHLKRFHLFRTSLADAEYRALVDARLAGQHKTVLTRLLPEGPLRADMDSQGIRAMLTVPIMVDGTWWGTLGLDDCVREVEWSAEELAFLRTAADLIAAVIYRQRLEDRTRQFAIIDASADSGVWDWAFDPGRLWFSGAVYRLLGYPPPFPRLPPRRLLRHVLPDHRDALMERLRRCMRGTSAGFRLDIQARRRNRPPVWLEVRAEVRRAADGRLATISGQVLEIEGRKQVEETLRGEASTDPLTGALNRRAFETAVADVLAQPERPGAPGIHLLALDIDHFKRVNDTHGHAVGDVALHETAARVRSILRSGDLLARIGGEEFAVLVTGDGAAALEVAERLRRAVAAQPVDVLAVGGPAEGLTLTVSIGLATRAPGETLAGVLRRADGALYAAKNAGRNRVMLAESASRTAQTVGDVA